MSEHDVWNIVSEKNEQIRILTAQLAEAQAKAEQAQEHKRLQNLVDSMAERLEAKDKQIKAKDYYIGLMAPYMAPVEAKKDVIIEEFAELLRAYRKATEGGEAE